MINTYLRKKVSKIKDTARQWNKEKPRAIFLKRMATADAVDDQNSAKSKIIHVFMFILGNLLVILLFVAAYFLL